MSMKSFNQYNHPSSSSIGSNKNIDDDDYLTKYRKFLRNDSHSIIRSGQERKNLLEKYSRDALAESNSSILGAIRYRNEYYSKEKLRAGYSKDNLDANYSKGMFSNDNSRETLAV